MKKLLPLLISMASLSVGFAAEPFTIYAPSSGSKTLMVVTATPTSDGVTLDLAETIDLGTNGRSIFAHPEKPILYVVPSRGDDVSAAVVYLDESGRYERHESSQIAHGFSYVSLDRTSQFLLGANYRDGYVDVYRVNKDGTIGEQVMALNEGRNSAHCALISPDNRFLYIPYVKDSNGLFQYAFDAKTGKLSALEPKNANPPEGTGPRHLAYHPTKPIIYFSNEQELGVSAYNMGKDGQLKIREVVAIDKEKAGGVTSASDIAITPDGKYIFTGLRSKEPGANWISRFAVDAEGDLTFLGLAKADQIPWGLTFSPDGKYLLVSATAGLSLTVFEIGDDGSLKKAGSLDWGESVSDLVTR